MTNDPTTKRLYLTRHGQAQHNVTSDWSIRDAILTPLGQDQCRQLNKMSQDSIQQKGDLLVCSPLRRTMETMLLSYPTLIKKLESEGKPPILLDILQECGNLPCDTALYPLEELKASRGGIFSHLDFSTLTPEYASKKGIYDQANAGERAREVRKWLRAREEKDIVVVAHGDLLRWVSDGYVNGYMSDREWENCAVKVFTFAHADDEDAALIEVDGGAENIAPPSATNAPTTEEMTSE